MNHTEQAWLRQMAAGDTDGFTRLYDAHGARVYRFCMRLCGHCADAEDLTQDVFVAAWQGAGGFQGRASVLTWLYRIALFRWHRVRRDKSRNAASWDDALEPPDPRGDMGRATLRRMTLEAALDALPDDGREAFLLVKSEGLKYREAALVLGVPQGTVQSRVHDAVQKLRVLLREETSDDV